MRAYLFVGHFDTSLSVFIECNVYAWRRKRVCVTGKVYVAWEEGEWWNFDFHNPDVWEIDSGESSRGDSGYIKSESLFDFMGFFQNRCNKKFYFFFILQ